MNCPIKSKECEKEQCAWWLSCNMCAVAVIADGMQSVECDVSAISGDLGNIADRGFPDTVAFNTYQNAMRDAARHGSGRG